MRRDVRRTIVAAAAILCLSATAPAQAQPAPGGRYEQIGPLRLYYEVHGQGKPLLILHGGGSTIETSFGAVLPMLAARRRVIAPEQQAHGHTADIDRPLSFSRMADDTAALLRRLGTGKVDVLGFSNGGSVAMELAIRHPDLVDRLVLGSVYYRRDAIRPELLRAFATADARSMPDIYRQAYLKVAPDPRGLDTLTPKLMRNLLGFDGWSDARLASIKAPTMIVQANDDVAPLEHVAQMARIIPGAQLVVLPGGHGAYLGEAMAAIPESELPVHAMGIIMEFLDAGPAAGMARKAR
ncbi:alpha/beta fold hydrolase [Sphingomonas colocasiae]|uniref:Alpha/beta hydrolase n=1 Tax=Sphingomonas colocasiae TaxID=1848973 RepID=A0ABS7PV28_9SPHN|nr:alpha/beta hydrolase [Sphingomonas colocasiae]MBY8825222.1 alpha/beta hydrolase [Sphingomonas colocasiae]